MDKIFLSREKYRLELRWQAVEYFEGECRFTNAYFSGPVLQLAEQIAPNESIFLDFYKQYYILVEDVYIGKLSWGSVCYKADKVFLDDCKMSHQSQLNKVPKLTSGDMLVIDCSNHEREVHAMYTNYKTYVSNQDTQVYTF